MSGSTPLRVGVLTTDTPHHRYFLRELLSNLPDGTCLSLVLFETKAYPWGGRAWRHFKMHFPDLWRGWALNPYIQSRRLGQRTMRFEQAHFFPDHDDLLPADLPVFEVHSVNDGHSAAILDRHPCDLYYVYGTGLVKPEVYRRPRLGAINAHGGLLPGYRGLDTNLWAALLGHPEDMAVTLHEVGADYDTGAVVRQERLGRIPGLSLLTLRYHTTFLVTRLTIDTIGDYVRGRVLARPQSGGNRYFGPMPHALKLRAGRLIERFVGEPK